MTQKIGCYDSLPTSLLKKIVSITVNEGEGIDLL